MKDEPDEPRLRSFLVPPDAKVPTQRGLLPVAELRPGDEIGVIHGDVVTYWTYAAQEKLEGSTRPQVSDQGGLGASSAFAAVEAMSRAMIPDRGRDVRAAGAGMLPLPVRSSRLEDYTALRSRGEPIMPLGFAAAKKDWNEAFAGRPYSLNDHVQLTIGEQTRYAEQELREQGMSVHTVIAPTCGEMVATLKVAMALGTGELQEDELRSLRIALERQGRETITHIMRLREFQKDALR